MTTVVAVKSAHGFIFGSDSQVSSHYYDNLGSAKFVRNGHYVVGAAGDVRTAQAVWFADLPTPPKGLANYDRFVSTVLVPRLREIEAEIGSASGSGAFILGFEGQLYEVYTAGLHIKSANSFCVIGSGTAFARGYLKSRHEQEGPFTEKDVYRALQAAAGNDLATSAPFYVEGFSFDQKD